MFLSAVNFKMMVKAVTIF